MPIKPSGETRTITRKMTPIMRVERAADDGQVVRAHVVVDDDERERAEPGALEPVETADDGDDEQVDRRRRGSIDAGSMWPFHQTKSTPPSAATKPATPKASVRCSATL